MKLEQILDQLLETQLQKDDGLFLSGLFPCDWKHPFLPQSGKDTNIFVTLTVHFILQEVKASLPMPLQEKIAKAQIGLEELVAKYQNKDGLETYNFWPTVDRVHFPGSIVFSRFSHFDIGDDLDDSALAFLVLKKPRSLAEKLHARMGKHANGQKRWIINTFDAFKQLPAYSTWFGTAKMPIEFDFCVFCNILAFVACYDLDLNKHDQAAITYIKGILNEKLFESQPYQSSPYYGETSVILYHFARLISTHHFSNFEEEKIMVLKWLEAKTSDHNAEATDHNAKAIDRNVHATTDSDTTYGHQLLFLNAYLKLGGKDLALFGPVINRIQQGQTPKIDYFIAGLLGTQEHPRLRKLAISKKSHITYSSTAINLALLLETRLLIEAVSNSSPTSGS